MPEREKVRFVRKGGRVIPIRAKGGKKEKRVPHSLRVGAAAAGVVGSGLAGRHTYRKVKALKKEKAKSLFTGKFSKYGKIKGKISRYKLLGGLAGAGLASSAFLLKTRSEAALDRTFPKEVTDVIGGGLGVAGYVAGRRLMGRPKDIRFFDENVNRASEMVRRVGKENIARSAGKLKRILKAVI